MSDDDAGTFAPDYLPAGLPYRNRQDEPIDLWTYQKLYPTDHQVADDTIGHIRISTIWTGYAPGGLFETMVFGGPLDLEGHRSDTEQEALIAHRLLVEVTTYAVEQGIWAADATNEGDPCPPSTST